MKIKKLAVITSGGDAPGMNSVLFGIFSACQDKNIKLYAGIGGYDGLIDNNFEILSFDKLFGNINRGGSCIRSSRSPRFLIPTHFKRAVKNLIDNKFDALIVIGGDGSLKGAKELMAAGINVINLPATIDNDMDFTYTIGFDTATNNIVNAVDNITDSIYSFGYGAVIKIMGRDCTDLIESAGSALHTDYIIRDKDFNLQKLVKSIKTHYDNQHLPPIVLVREDSVDCAELAQTLQEKLKFQWRPHILGYIQRGGTPSAFDRRYGYEVGKIAVESAINNEFGIIIGLENNDFVKKSF